MIDIGPASILENADNMLVQSSTGYLMVALTETKDNVLGPKGLKALVGAYATTGIALAVWEAEKQEWIRLTPEMLWREEHLKGSK